MNRKQGLLIVGLILLGSFGGGFVATALFAASPVYAKPKYRTLIEYPQESPKAQYLRGKIMALHGNSGIYIGSDTSNQGYISLQDKSGRSRVYIGLHKETGEPNIAFAGADGRITWTAR